MKLNIKKIGCCGNDDGSRGCFVHVLYTGGHVKMLSRAASFKRACGRIFGTVLCGRFCFLYLIDKKPHGNRKPSGISGQYGRGVLLRNGLSLCEKASGGGCRGGYRNRYYRRYAVLSGGEISARKSGSGPVHLCAAVFGEYGWRECACGGAAWNFMRVGGVFLHERAFCGRSSLRKGIR